MNIKQLRKDLGLSQKELAKKLKVAQGYVSNWESGVRNPKPDLLEKLKALADKQKPAKKIINKGVKTEKLTRAIHLLAEACKLLSELKSEQK